MFRYRTIGCRRVHAGEDEVQEVLVVEVVHDGFARLVQPIDADEVADVLEFADRMFVAVVMIEREGT